MVLFFFCNGTGHFFIIRVVGLCCMNSLLIFIPQREAFQGGFENKEFIGCNSALHNIFTQSPHAAYMNDVPEPRFRLQRKSHFIV
jgi:hypothetical protein